MRRTRAHRKHILSRARKRSLSNLRNCSPKTLLLFYRAAGCCLITNINILSVLPFMSGKSSTSPSASVCLYFPPRPAGESRTHSQPSGIFHQRPQPQHFCPSLRVLWPLQAQDIQGNNSFIVLHVTVFSLTRVFYDTPRLVSCSTVLVDWRNPPSCGCQLYWRTYGWKLNGFHLQLLLLLLLFVLGTKL